MITIIFALLFIYIIYYQVTNGFNIYAMQWIFAIIAFFVGKILIAAGRREDEDSFRNGFLDLEQSRRGIIKKRIGYIICITICGVGAAFLIDVLHKMSVISKALQ